MGVLCLCVCYVLYVYLLGSVRLVKFMIFFLLFFIVYLVMSREILKLAKR